MLSSRAAFACNGRSTQLWPCFVRLLCVIEPLRLPAFRDTARPDPSKINFTILIFLQQALRIRIQKSFYDDLWEKKLRVKRLLILKSLVNPSHSTSGPLGPHRWSYAVSQISHTYGNNGDL